MNTIAKAEAVTAEPQPWWRHGHMWLVVGGPAVVVVASIATLVLAIRTPDPVLAEDAYDTRGGLWRASLHGLVQAYDAQVPFYRFGIYHDLNSGGYLVGGLDNEVREPIQFDARAKAGDFQPDALRRLGGAL